MFAGDELVEARPAIPVQRAVVKWDGELETMIVESTLAAPRGRYGWVVPVPVRPEFVRAVKPEYVSQSFAQVGVPVKRLSTKDPTTALIFAAAISVLLLTAGLRYRNLEVGWRLCAYAGEALVCALVMLAVLQNDGPTKIAAKSVASAANPPPGRMKAMLDVQSLGTIGSYDVSVLKGEDASEVLNWLRKHHIRVPKSAKSAIENYAREDWFFVAAEFRKDEDRPLPPHPLKVVFRTGEPVYPMRLTGTQDQPLRLELLVVGDRQAKVEPLHLWRSGNDPVVVNVMRDPWMDKEVFGDWKGNQYAMAKDGEVITYLRAEVQPEEMREDYRLTWGPYERFEAEVVDRRQARENAGLMFAGLLPLIAGIFGLVGVGWNQRLAAVAVIGGVVAASFAGGVAGRWYTSVEKVEAEYRMPPYWK